MKLSTKMTLGYLLIGLMLVACGLSGVYGVGRLSHVLDDDSGFAVDAADGKVNIPVESIPAIRRNVQWMIGSSVVAGLVMTGFAVWFTERSMRPIRRLVERAKAIAMGDLTGEALPTTSRDEVGQLTASMNDMSKSLSTLVAKVTGSAGAVGKAAKAMAAVSEEICRGMDDQRVEITQISSTVGQMSASTQQVAGKSTEAVEGAEASGMVAQEGGQVVDQMIRSMETINQAVSSSATSVKQLGEQGQQIGQIIEVINDIADQTNLLALNAAIEAARAGEHGRGFAVVADEVRKLADRTMKATSQVAKSIHAIQTETDVAVCRMDTGAAEVSGGVEQAQQAGESLGRIVEQTKGVVGMVQSIAAAALQQSAASGTVHRSVDSISQITEQVAQQGGMQAAESVSDLIRRSFQLQAELSRFRLRFDVTGKGAQWTRRPTDPVKILVVDDDPDFVRLMEKFLEGRGECIPANSGAEALASVRAMLEQGYCYDLICLDIAMPNMDGHQTLADLRQLEESFGLVERKRSKVMMITSLDTPQDKLKAFRASCAAYVNKPIDRASLLEVIDSLGIRRPISTEN